MLYAYNKSVAPAPDQRVNAAPFRNNENYEPSDQETDIENAIRTVHNDSNFTYANSIIKYLFEFDYIGKAKKDINVTYYGLTLTGKLFFENNGFEKTLKDDQKENSENFYKWTTLFLACSAVVIPIMYNEYFNKSNEVSNSLNLIKVSIDSLTQTTKKAIASDSTNVFLNKNRKKPD